MKTWKVTVTDGIPSSYNDPWPQVPAQTAEDAEAAAEATAKWALSEVIGSSDYQTEDMITVRVFDENDHMAYRMMVECP